MLYVLQFQIFPTMSTRTGHTLCFPNVSWCLQLVVYFRWVVGEWGECSVSCGDGVQKREIVCRQEITPTLTMTVAEGACLTPPSTLSRSRTCQRRPCSGSDTQWSVGAWSQVLCARKTNSLTFSQVWPECAVCPQEARIKPCTLWNIRSKEETSLWFCLFF